MIVDEALPPEALVLPSQEYRGSYRSARTVELDGKEVPLVSVNASPIPSSDHPSLGCPSQLVERGGESFERAQT